MRCRQCGLELDRPGDFCLRCETANADTVVLELTRERATVTALLDDEVVSAYEVTTTPEDGEFEPVELRNFAGLVADELHRKRPEEVYATGDRDVLGAIREQAHYEFYRIAGDDPVESVVEHRGEPALETVDAAPAEKPLARLDLARFHFAITR